MKNWLICYDIEDNKERNAIYKCLLKYGDPVQKSVFEVSFPQSKQREQTEMIEALTAIAGDNANIRFYNLTGQGLKASWTFDNSPILARPGAVIL